MMCEEPAAAEPAPVVEAATPEPPPMTPDLPKEEGIDFSRCAGCRRGAGRSTARVRAVAASRTSRRRGRRTPPLRPRAPLSRDRRYSITISLLAVFALVKVLSAVGILDVD